MLRWLGVKEGDEVIVPAYTYCATANVVLHCGATPVMVDCKDDFNIDVSNLDNNCKHSVKGTATEKEGDLESREMDGDAVFVQEYVYNGDDCELYISLEMDGESAAWINQGDCKDVDPMCKLEPKGYLTLKN